MPLIKKWVVCLAWISSSALAGDRYKIDPEHTFSTFEYTHWGLSLQRGRFEKNSGVIELDPVAKIGSIEIQIETASVDTSLDIFNDVLRSEQFFDAAQFPKIIFQSTAMHFDEDRLTQVDGDLTIKGVTRPAKFEITYFNCRFMILYLSRACGANGFTRILRSDFNVGRLVPFVSDAVTLYFSVEAIHE